MLWKDFSFFNLEKKKDLSVKFDAAGIHKQYSFVYKSKHLSNWASNW